MPWHCLCVQYRYLSCLVAKSNNNYNLKIKKSNSFLNKINFIFSNYCVPVSVIKQNFTKLPTTV